MDYTHVPPGFEMVLSQEDGTSLLSPGSGGGSWGLWFNVSLTDNPSSWDEEVERLNQLQLTLPALGDELRLVRAHIAEFCRYHPLFPGSVKRNIRNIGAEQLLDAGNIGCEGRGLLRTLGVQTESMRENQGRDVALSASKALRKAVKGEEFVSPLEKKYSLFVGQMGRDEKGTASWLADVLSRGEPETKSFRELCGAHGHRAYGDALPEGRPFSCFFCEQGSGPCCFSQQADAALICISGMDAKKAVKHFRRFSEEYVLAYCDALNSWLADSPLVDPWADIEAFYVTEQEAEAIAQETAETLGDKSPTKIWLTGCLLKTLKSNQRWHGHEELLDDFPDCVSWLE